MNTNPLLKPIHTDSRTQVFLRPTRIVAMGGDIDNAELLLREKPEQLLMNDVVEVCTMRNHGSEHAWILLDLGAEIHGRVRIMTHMCEPKWMRAQIRLGESVSEAMTPVDFAGNEANHALRDYEIAVRYFTCIDSNESGFRFVRFELLGDNAALQLRSIDGILIVRDLEYIGSFESSDPLLNEIYRTCAYTTHLNCQEYIWDGIQRDRMVWSGDMHPEVITYCTVFGEGDVIPKSLDFNRDTYSLDKATRYHWMNGIPAYSMWWIMCHYDYFMQNGDMAYLREQKAYLCRLLGMLCDCIGPDGAEILPDRRLLDWPTQADADATHAGLHGLLSLTLQAGAYLADLLGDTDTAARCLESAEKMKKHRPATAFKQAEALLVLGGIEDAVTADREVIAKGGAHGYSTFFSYYILAARAIAGKTAEALDDLREYYGAMLRLGATTFWEDFSLDWVESAGGFENIARIDEPVTDGKVDIHGDFGAYCYVGLRHSLCHGWSSGPAAFLARYILGVKILEPGCRKLEIKPNLCGLEYVKGTYPTPRGTVRIYADKNGVKIDAPDGIEIVR